MRRLKVEAAPAAVAPVVETEAVEAGTVIEVRSGDSLVSFRGDVWHATLPLGMRGTNGCAVRSPSATVSSSSRRPQAKARIVDVLPRRSALRRSIYDPSRDAASYKGHVIAANIDQVVVVCFAADAAVPAAADRSLSRRGVARRAAGPHLSEQDATLACLTKSSATWTATRNIGVECVRTSAVEQSGLNALRERLAGTVSLFTGHSGVGKSSLLNAVEAGLALRVNDVTQSTAGQGKGRHTTSSARLVPLSMPETFVVDSPGIRAFGVKGVPLQELGVALRRHRCAGGGLLVSRLPASRRAGLRGRRRSAPRLVPARTAGVVSVDTEGAGIDKGRPRRTALRV